MWGEAFNHLPGGNGAWPLDDAGGPTIPRRAGGNPLANAANASYNGTLTKTYGPSNGLRSAMVTDGSASYVEFPAFSLGNASEQTWTGWFWFAADVTSASSGVNAVASRTNSGCTAIGFGATTSLLTNEVIGVYNELANANARTGWTGITIPAGWRHICMAYNGTQNGWSCYLDGINVESGLGATKVSNASGSRGFLGSENWTIGRDASLFYSVTAAGFAVFRYFFTQEDVSRVYRAGKDGWGVFLPPPPPPVFLAQASVNRIPVLS